MRFSIQKEKITPHIPVFQGGFGARMHKSEGIHSDPYASVVVIQANKTVVIIALDLLGGDRSFANGIKKAINEKYGLEEDEIIINYSHTHSVVGVTGEDEETRSHRSLSITQDRYIWDLDKEDKDYTEDIKYFNTIKTKILYMLNKGFQNLIEGDMYICKGKSKFGVSRRFPYEQRVLFKPNFDENVIDMDLFLFKFIDKDNNIHGLIYNYACHATTLGPDNYLISADFPGVVRKYLEEYNPGMIPIFLQGCGADIKPYISADNDQFKSCNYDELEEAGISLAKEIQKLINKPDKKTHELSEKKCEDNIRWRKIDINIRTRSDEVKLYTEVWDIQKWESIINDPEEPHYRKVSVKKILSDTKAGRVKNYLPYYISLLRLDKSTCIIALEREVVSDIGKNIKKIISDEDIIVLGYSNEVFCYIPSRKVLLEGGYESKSFIPTRLAGPFVYEVEDIIIGRSVMMAKNR